MARIKLKYVNAFANRGRKDKRVRYYFRRRGGKAMPLPGLPGSEEFMAAYAAALAGLPHVEIGASRTLPGTINALVVNYYRSDDWQKLAADTKKNRRRVIERFRAKHGNKRVALLQREHILGMLAAIERPSAKRHWLKCNSRPAAGRRADHAQGRSDGRHCRHQDAQDQGSSHLD